MQSSHSLIFKCVWKVAEDRRLHTIQIHRKFLLLLSQAQTDRFLATNVRNPNLIISPLADPIVLFMWTKLKSIELKRAQHSRPHSSPEQWLAGRLSLVIRFTCAVSFTYLLDAFEALQGYKSGLIVQNFSILKSSRSAPPCSCLLDFSNFKVITNSYNQGTYNSLLIFNWIVRSSLHWWSYELSLKSDR